MYRSLVMVECLAMAAVWLMGGTENAMVAPIKTNSGARIQVCGCDVDVARGEVCGFENFDGEGAQVDSSQLCRVTKATAKAVPRNLTSLTFEGRNSAPRNCCGDYRLVATGYRQFQIQLRLDQDAKAMVTIFCSNLYSSLGLH
jgi:hypothetical protein